MSEQISLIKALIKSQSKFHNLTKNKSGYNYEYLTLDKLIEETRDILTENGLVIVQTMDTTEGGGSEMITTLYHEEGGSLSSSYRLEPVAVGKANSAQMFGAAITYARRYSLAAILNIAQADDDAAGVEAKAKPKPKPKPKPAPKKTLSTMQQKVADMSKARGIDGGKFMERAEISDFFSLSDGECEQLMHALDQGSYDG